MEAKDKVVLGWSWADELEPSLEEEPLDVAAIMATPLPALVPQSGLLDAWIDKQDTPPPVIETEAVTTDYAWVFREMEEGERTCIELEQELAAWTETTGDLSGAATAGAAAPWEAAREQPPAPGGGEEAFLSGGSPAFGAIAAGAAILAGAGAAKAKTQGPSSGEEPEVRLWHYAFGGRQYGPLAAAQLQEKLRTGELSPEGHVWRPGMSQWVTAREAGLLAAPVAEAEAWFYLAGQQTVGPVAKEELLALLRSQRLSSDCLVWTEGMAAWQSAVAAGLAEAAVLHCPACDRPTASGSRFCGGCGAPLGNDAAAQAAPAPVKPVCPTCQAEVKPNARFCGKCGQRL